MNGRYEGDTLSLERNLCISSWWASCSGQAS